MIFLRRDLTDPDLVGCVKEGWPGQAGYVCVLLRAAVLQNAPTADHAGALVVNAHNGVPLRGLVHSDRWPVPGPTTTTLLDT